MKQISARQFRTSFADLTEPVTVSRRDPESGEYVSLGSWYPANTIAPAGIGSPDGHSRAPVAPTSRPSVTSRQEVEPSVPPTVTFNRQEPTE